jgi:hypothetical protein
MLSLMFILSGCGKVEKEDAATGPDTSAPEVSVPEKTGPKSFYCHFKADFTQRINRAGEGETTIEGTTWENCTSTRTESSMTPPGVPAPIRFVSINRPDLNVSWQLFEKSRKYVENPLDEPASGEGYQGPPIYDKTKASYEKEGTETVNGYDCVKYKVTVSVPGEELQEFYVWSAKDLKDLVIRQEFTMADGSMYTWELSNIELGKQPDDVFEIPAGYTKATEAEMGTLMMQEMMGGSMPTMPNMPMAPPTGE